MYHPADSFCIAMQGKEEEKRRRKAELKKKKREDQIRLMEEEAARKGASMVYVKIFKSNQMGINQFQDSGMTFRLSEN